MKGQPRKGRPLVPSLLNQLLDHVGGAGYVPL